MPFIYDQVCMRFREQDQNVLKTVRLMSVSGCIFATFENLSFLLGKQRFTTPRKVFEPIINRAVYLYFGMRFRKKKTHHQRKKNKKDKEKTTHALKNGNSPKLY